MAFVYRDPKRFILDNKETIIAGPGDYDISKPDNELNKQYKVPFNTISHRKDFSNNSIPGPGAYINDSSYIKKKIFNINKTTPDMPEIDPFTNEAIDNLFISSEPRFKDSSRENSPGPGQYDIISNGIKVSKKLNRKITCTSASSRKYDTLSPSRVLSIPNKRACYGYKENEKGEFVLNTDPNISLKFTGEKKDSIGPDRYKVEEYYSKKRPNKISAWKRNYTAKKYSNKILEKDYPEEITNANNVSKSSTRVQTEINASNYQSPRQRKVKQFKLYKNSNKIYQYDYGSSQLNKDLAEIEKRSTDIPGPGAYSPMYAGDKIKFQPKPIQYQNFGSSLARSVDLSKIGNKEKLPDNYLIIKERAKNRTKKFVTRPITHHPERTREEQIKNNNIQQKEEMKKYLGPGSYDPKIGFQKPSSNVGNFNVMEKRFAMSKTESTPGAGSYLRIDTWAKEPLHIPKPIEPVEKKVKPVEYPGVGQYHPETVNSIEYQVKSNVSKKKNVPFDSNNMRFKLEKKENPNVGPGAYSLRKDMVNEGESLIPFGVGSRRKDLNQCDNDIGPGDYVSDSYFNWNKKSFNVLFV